MTHAVLKQLARQGLSDLRSSGKIWRRADEILPPVG